MVRDDRHADDRGVGGAGLSPDLDVSLVERYTDGAELSDGLIQDIRLDIARGTLSFRAGVRPHERAAVIIDVSAAAARKHNSLYSTDPTYQQTRDHYQRTGEMCVEGDPSRLGGWLDAVHDPIVDRTI